jgi:uncharacterized protein (DUF362 family)
MSDTSTRRQFLAQIGTVAAGAALSGGVVTGCRAEPGKAPRQRARHGPRVVIARDEELTSGRADEHRELLRKLLDGSMQRLTDAQNATAAWRDLFSPNDRVGIKVNTLGLSTQPAVVDAVVAGLRRAGVKSENIVVWDRFDVELAQAGFELNKSGRGVRCRGTDARQYGSGYQKTIESSGRIGSCFSRIAAEEVDTLISVPVLKDHNLAGVSLGMKNFFGAIHNPNKYHDNNCDPFVVDVVSHRFIGPKWRLTVCDGVRAQYNAGPGRHPGFAWPFGGLIVSDDLVAADAVAADLLEKQRSEKGLKSLAEEERPPRHIATARTRGLGEADLSKIERIEV